jgi:hypothetical protein
MCQKQRYSIDLCRDLRKAISRAALEIPTETGRYEKDDLLQVPVTGVWPETSANATLRIRKFVGGGFAGQVYLCALEKLDLPTDQTIPGLRVGDLYGVKLLVPPSRFSRKFRNALYWLAFQGPFSAQVNQSAARAGVIRQKLLRLTARTVFGREDAVADIYASFYDPNMRTHGEIMEWVDGRTWLLETDVHISLRRKWKTVSLSNTDSPEFIAKRRFMAQLTGMLKEMGFEEFARQYEWWTMKSQPNVLKRKESQTDPAAGLCAIDFRPGLALLPFLPMSPGDIPLICRGLLHGSFVQFDHTDFRKFRQFIEKHKDLFENHSPMLKAFEQYDRSYRRSLPDIWRHGLRLLVSRALRHDVRSGLIEGYVAAGTADHAFADRLRASSGLFTGYYLLGLRRVWGNAAYRRHLKRLFTEKAYFKSTMTAGLARRLISWHRKGRTGEARTQYLRSRPALFWLQRCTLGFLPAKLHRAIAEPHYVVKRVREMWRFTMDFFKNDSFREQWLTEQIEQGFEEGMLSESEHATILKHVRDPFIVKYLKALGVHFATLPVTQVVSLLVGGIAAVWVLMTGGTWTRAAGLFAFVLVLFQITPISPGSICRGVYVMYLVIRDRNFRDYMVAAPLSFVKYLGYLAFPMQMITTYPALARFMAGRWATGAVHIIPVFGEKGALLEHAVFDWFFNIPRIIGIWAKKRIRYVLDVWMILGLTILTAVVKGCNVDWFDQEGTRIAINLVLAVTVVFVLPRLFFYPLMVRRTQSR